MALWDDDETNWESDARFDVTDPRSIADRETAGRLQFEQIR